MPPPPLIADRTLGHRDRLVRAVRRPLGRGLGSTTSNPRWTPRT